MCALNELEKRFPVVVKLMSAILSDFDFQSNRDRSDYARLSTRLCVAFAVMLQGRNKQLSAVQRLVTTCLLDSVCDAKVSYYC